MDYILSTILYMQGAHHNFPHVFLSLMQFHNILFAPHLFDIQKNYQFHDVVNEKQVESIVIKIARNTFSVRNVDIYVYKLLIRK